MRFKSLLIVFACFFACVFQLKASEDWNAAREFEVIEVMPFADEATYFTLSDGSTWLSTKWHGPTYLVRVGQHVTVTPMTDGEVEQHEAMWKEEESLIPYRPYWLMIQPEEGESLAAVALIAFQTVP